MNQYHIPGLSIGIVQNGSIIYSKGYGVKSIATTNLVTENSIFHTASISKLFTAVAIVDLVEEKVFTLDDKLVHLIPDLQYNDQRVREISVKNLLNHTSGLKDIKNYNWRKNHQADHSLKDYVLGHQLKLKANPSSQYAYNNLAYDVLGYLIEKKTHTTYDVFLKENILDKTGMTNSDFRYFKIQDALKTEPHGKRLISKNIYTRKTYPYTREHAPSSTLNASATDLSQWMISFMHDLENSAAKNAYRKMIEPSFNAKTNIGLGFQLSKISGEKTIGHYGGDKGFRSYLIMIPSRKIGLVLLANCDYEEDFRQEILHPIAKILVEPLNEG